MNRIGLALLFVSFSSTAYACGCVAQGPACQAFWAQHPQAVFVARVVSIVRESHENIVTMEVSESFHPELRGTVTVRTASMGSACGYDFEQGQQYLVWADARNMSDLRVDLCSRTRPLQEAGPDLEYLRTVSSRDNTSWIYGDAWQYVFDPNFELPDPAAPKDANGTPERGRSMKPLAGATVIATDTNGRMYQSVVDAEGQYSLMGLPPGKYSVRLDVPRTMEVWPFIGQNEFDLKPRGCGQVDFRAQIDGRVSGVVTDEQGKPVRHVEVGLSDAFIVRERVERFSERFFHANADEHGRFELKGIPAGEYVLYVERPQTGPIGPDYFPDLTYYPRVRNPKAATVIKLGEAERLTGAKIRMLPPRQRTPQCAGHPTPSVLCDTKP